MTDTPARDDGAASDRAAGDRAAGGRAAGGAPPARVRVTAPRPDAPRHPSAATGATGAPESTDVPAVYVRSLIRSQLRLALVCAGGFVIATALFVFAIVWAPALDETFVAGVPVSWLLLAAGVYPLAITVAALYVRAATRNEARYRSLAEDA
ncbi:DUF485 domain-containing protein [Agromyces aerolatus]|uniref:hypothetical protein n=1 Tax=Agromyces sp. LY-1074 TaxID=3074080 RepID=UPI002855531D|nr:MULTISPECIES: hypothetical protein [unclassified Agromyces]MDR5701700.1 hypothetical protein [Agromyces sp. LY-1074]MDR5707953.1 hypothetical protein [Agromyces sp. LY-1358]